MKMFTLKTREIVKTLLLEIENNDQSQVYCFKVEVIQETENRFVAELYERIYYRLQPSFDLPEPNWQADEELWVHASHQLRYDTTSTTPEACIHKVLCDLNEMFGNNITA